MDLVLSWCDEHFLDSIWAAALPLRIPADADVPSAAAFTASASSSILASSSKLLSPTLAAAVKRAWPSASLAAVAQASSGTDGAWTTVSAWPRDDVRRQIVSLVVLVQLGVYLMYFGIAGFSYHFLYDKRLMKHPRFHKNQVRQEIAMSLRGFPWLNAMTLPWFFAEVRGYSMMYKDMSEGPFGNTWLGYGYAALSAAAFLAFTDWAIYWVHRWLHIPAVYKHLHKPHHKWVIPTPFASHAFHPIDGYLQSLPYHIFAFAVPVHRKLYLGLFAFVNLWSILIHDADMKVGGFLEKFINGPAHHTLHHMFFTVNYGQYFVFNDVLGGSFRQPTEADDPLHTVLRRERNAKTAKDE